MQVVLSTCMCKLITPTTHFHTPPPQVKHHANVSIIIPVSLFPLLCLCHSLGLTLLLFVSSPSLLSMSYSPSVSLFLSLSRQIKSFARPSPSLFSERTEWKSEVNEVCFMTIKWCNDPPDMKTLSRHSNASGHHRPHD